MSRILLVGVGPLPSAEKQRVYAPGLKLEAFLKALRRAGSEILLGEIYFSGIEDDFDSLSGNGIVEHRLLGPQRDQIPGQLKEWIDQSKPDAVIASTDIGCLCAVESGFKGPLLAAYFGSPIAERQQQAFVHESNASLHLAWLDVLPVLLRADRFVVESNSQRLALIGELGAAGRLNAETCEREMVDIVKPSLPFEEPLALNDEEFLKKHGVPEDAKVILSTGGYNTWVDEETLFLGVEDALRQNEKLHFVSTGGGIEGHVEVVYKRFVARIEKSPVKDKFHLLGWVRHDELFNTMLLADVAVNCDRWSLEGELGARNRVLGWLWAGLRVVSTVSSDSVRELVEQGWVRNVESGNWQALSNELQEEAEKSESRSPAAEEARRAELMRAWGPKRVMAPLENWAREPKKAPDRHAGDDVSNPLTDLQRGFLTHAKSVKETRELVARLEGSRAFRLYMATHPEVRDLMEKLKNS